MAYIPFTIDKIELLHRMLVAVSENKVVLEMDSMSNYGGQLDQMANFTQDR